MLMLHIFILRCESGVTLAQGLNLGCGYLLDQGQVYKYAVGVLVPAIYAKVIPIVSIFFIFTEHVAVLIALLYYIAYTQNLCA